MTQPRKHFLYFHPPSSDVVMVLHVTQLEVEIAVLGKDQTGIIERVTFEKEFESFQVTGARVQKVDG